MSRRAKLVAEPEQGTVAALTHDGAGIVRDGKAAFVGGALVSGITMAVYWNHPHFVLVRAAVQDFWQNLQFVIPLVGLGLFAAGCLVCPWHAATYDVETGQMLRGPQGVFAKIPGLESFYRLLTSTWPLRRGATGLVQD